MVDRVIRIPLWLMRIRSGVRCGDGVVFLIFVQQTPNPNPNGGPARPKGKVKLRETT